MTKDTLITDRLILRKLKREDAEPMFSHKEFIERRSEVRPESVTVNWYEMYK